MTHSKGFLFLRHSDSLLAFLLSFKYRLVCEHSFGKHQKPQVGSAIWFSSLASALSLLGLKAQPLWLFYRMGGLRALSSVKSV